ncbi:glycosyltransferase [Larkinella sp. GY13]|uniref:glycosyltransferase n=1 Tax=Larkinella sp. GY13 TaxID=3453720 RepID=UPI003EEBF27A
MAKTPLVSICSTTYNLEKYISEAIDNWLMQRTNFEFEIIICDDCSVDNTVAIVESYIQRWPDKITLFKTEQNLGMMSNYIRSIVAAQGKYIAICDGDDYWIDENKLQMQVDFLESNTDFVASLTNSIVLNDETKETKIAKTLVWDEADSLDLLFHDDFNKDNIDLSAGHVSTYLFRNHLIEKYPDWFYDDDVITDFPLYLINSKYGKTKFFNTSTSVYRNRIGSHSFTWYGYLKIQRSRIKMYKCINEYLEYRYEKRIKEIIAKHYLNIFKYSLKNSQTEDAFFAFMDVFKNNPKEILCYFFTGIKNRLR